MEPHSPEWYARIEMLLAQEATQPMRLWYLSFADGRFLGAAIVEARGLVSAWKRTHELGINPGGEVCTFQIPEEKAHLIHESQKHRLLNRAEAESLGTVQ